MYEFIWQFISLFINVFCIFFWIYCMYGYVVLGVHYIIIIIIIEVRNMWFSKVH